MPRLIPSGIPSLMAVEGQVERVAISLFILSKKFFSLAADGIICAVAVK